MVQRILLLAVLFVFIFTTQIQACENRQEAYQLAQMAHNFALAVEEKVFEKRNFLYNRMLDYCLVGSKLVGLPSPLKDATVLTLQDGIRHFREVKGLYYEVRKIEEKNYIRTRDRRELRVSLKYLDMGFRAYTAMDALIRRKDYAESKNAK